MRLDRDVPWTWTRRDVLGLLTSRQRRYVETLEGVFRVKNASGRVVDYRCEPYQAWFHAHSPLAMGTDAPDRLVPKGRGLGLTLMTAMDLLLLAHQQDRVHIPVAGRQSSTGDEFIQKAHDLVYDCAIDGFFDPDPHVSSTVRLGNGSTIEPVPGGNPSAFRGKRAPASALDEYAFHPKARDTWRAARGVLTEGGQLTVLSTHDGAGTHFYELVEAAEKGEVDFALFPYPTHDPVAWDPNVPVPDQIASGRLKLLAPWIDVAGLEKMRREDPLGYAQEHLCQVMDEALNLLSRDAVAAVHDPDLASWEGPIGLDESPLLVDLKQPLRVPRRPAGNANPTGVGVDFASNGDLAAYTLLERTSDGYLEQRWLAKLEGVQTPQQNALLRLVVATAKPRFVCIDMTGPGTGLYEYADAELHDKTEVVGIHFSQRVKVGEEQDKDTGQLKDVKAPVKKAMALTLSRLVQERRVRFLGRHPLTELHKRHLGAIRRKDLDAPRKAGEGHADLFWADALCAWGFRELLHDTGAGVLLPSRFGGLREGASPPEEALMEDVPETSGVLLPSRLRRGSA